MKLIIRKIMISGHSPTDIEPIYKCDICPNFMRYGDIWVVEDFTQHTKYISCCSQLCGEMAILQNMDTHA